MAYNPQFTLPAVGSEVFSSDLPPTDQDLAQGSVVTRVRVGSKRVEEAGGSSCLRVDVIPAGGGGAGALQTRFNRSMRFLKRFPLVAPPDMRGLLGELREGEGDGGEVVMRTPLLGLVANPVQDAGVPRFVEVTAATLEEGRASRFGHGGARSRRALLGRRLDTKLDLRRTILRLVSAVRCLHSMESAHRRITPSAVLLHPAEGQRNLDGPVVGTLAGMWSLFCSEDDAAVRVGGGLPAGTVFQAGRDRRGPPEAGEEAVAAMLRGDCWSLGDVIAEITWGVSGWGVVRVGALEATEEDGREREGASVAIRGIHDYAVADGFDVRVLDDANPGRGAICFRAAQRACARAVREATYDRDWFGPGMSEEERAARLDALRVRADPLLVDLCSKLCAVNPAERLSASGAASHPFFLSYQQRIVWLSNVAESTGPDPVPHHTDFTKRYFQELECSSTPPPFPQPPPRIAEHPNDWVVREEESERKVREEVLGLEGEEDVGKTGARRVDWVRACALRAEAVGGGGGGGAHTISMEYRVLQMAFRRDGVVIGAGSDPTVWMGEQVETREERLAQLRQNQAAAPPAAHAHIQVQIDRNEDERQRLTAWITCHRGGRGSIAERAMLMRGGAAGGVAGPLEDETRLLFRQALDNDGERVWTHLYNNPIDPAATSPPPLPTLLAPVHISQLLRQVRNQWHHSYSHERVGDRHGDVEAELYHVLGGGLFLWVWEALQRASAHHPSPPWASFVSAVVAAPPLPQTAASLLRLVRELSPAELAVARGDAALLAEVRAALGL